MPTLSGVCGVAALVQVIRIEWTPRISLIERRVNSNQLDNVRLAMEDRQPSHFSLSKSLPLTNHLF
jgi:hypothetical protein